MSTIVYMDEVLRQDDPQFLGLLNAMREGQWTDVEENFLLSRLESNLDESECAEFQKEDVLTLVPKWADAQKIIFDYLQHKMTA